MIEDKELKEIFKIESEEHLQNLDSGLLRLEKTPEDQGLLEEVFREAHSLKGSARMLGLSDIVMLAHRLEDNLGKARKGESTLSSEMIDGMFHTLHTVRKLVTHAVAPESEGSETSSPPVQAPALKEPGIPQAPTPPVSPSLRTETPPPAGESDPELLPTHDAGPREGTVSQASDQVPTDLVGASESKIDGFRIETIRVGTKKLDALMAQIGELSVTTNRVGLRMEGVEEILGVWEDLKAGGQALHDLLSAMEHNASACSSTRLLDCRKRHTDITELFDALLIKLRNAVYEDRSKLTFITTELEDGVRSIRLLPLSTIFNLFPRMVRDLAREQSKEIRFVVEGGEIAADKRIVEEMKDPIMHMIRNAIDHGIELPDVRVRIGKPREATLLLKASQTPTNVVIEVRDDGRGLDVGAIKRTALRRRVCREEELEAMSLAQIHALIFSSGFSTSTFVSDVSGRGVGLDVVRTNVERLKGSLQVESAKGCAVRIQLPITLATTRVLILEAGGINYAIPVEDVVTTRLVRRREIFVLEGRDAMILYGRPISVARLVDLLELPSVQGDMETPVFACVVLCVGEERLGLLVDTILDEQEIVLKPQSLLLKRVRNISGATILGTGEVCMVLNPSDLVKSIRKRELSLSVGKPTEEERKKVILLAEDSITTRTQMKRILEGGGYEVIAAVDGVDAFNKLGTGAFDALVSDVQMPNMDGLTLASRVREDKKYQEIPIVLVTSLASDEDKKAGIEAGANAYITKPAFDQQVLLETLDRLI